MFTDRELLKIQKLAKPYDLSFKNGEVAEDIKTLMELRGEITLEEICPRCGCFGATFFGEGGDIPDGRVTCPCCLLSTRYHRHTSKKFDFRFNKYRDVREARADWLAGKVYDFGNPGGAWKSYEGIMDNEDDSYDYEYDPEFLEALEEIEKMLCEEEKYGK